MLQKARKGWQNTEGVEGVVVPGGHSHHGLKRDEGPDLLDSREN